MIVQYDKALDIAPGNYTVYKHTSPGGKVYVGITRDRPQRRWKGGHGYEANAHFWRAINAYGWQAFKHEILAKGLTQQEAEAMEIKLIAEHDSTNPAKGYNIAPGGNTQSAETRAKISAALTGVPLSKERRARLSETRKGRRLSEGCKRKISESHKVNPKVQNHILTLNRERAGKPKTEEHKRKLSESQKRRPVKNIDTGEVFGGVGEAARSVRGSHTNIIKACKGERQTAYGHRWAYIPEEAIA